jgi:RNA polymerase sigma-70 factor (ECF subfamily)
LKAQLAADLSSPSGHAMARERDEQLERALGNLPDHYRRVILLRHRDNLSFAEIGDVMQLSENAARKLWWRAIERLQQDVEQMDERP